MSLAGARTHMCISTPLCELASDHRCSALPQEASWKEATLATRVLLWSCARKTSSAATAVPTSVRKSNSRSKPWGTSGALATTAAAPKTFGWPCRGSAGRVGDAGSDGGDRGGDGVCKGGGIDGSDGDVGGGGGGDCAGGDRVGRRVGATKGGGDAGSTLNGSEMTAAFAESAGGIAAGSSEPEEVLSCGAAVAVSGFSIAPTPNSGASRIN